MISNKMLISILIAIPIMGLGCQKDEPIHQELLGQWEWIWTHYPHPDTLITPINSGIQEILSFNADHTWSKTQNDSTVDFGEFSCGHGSFTPVSGGHIFIYDSIVYYKNGQIVTRGIDYYIITNDTLYITPYLAGRFSSYSFPYNGSKQWIRK